MGFHVLPAIGLAPLMEHGMLDCTHPHATTGWLLGCEKPQDLHYGGGKAQSEVPVELPGAGFGVSGLMEAKTSRFSLLGTANSAEGRGRAENSVWACWWTLASEQRGKGREERALAGYRREESPCLTRRLTWFGGSCVWNAERSPGKRLNAQLVRGRPAPSLYMADPKERKHSMVSRCLF